MNDKSCEHGHHPSTYNATHTTSDGIAWDDHASIHLASEENGVMDAMGGVHSGTFAEMVSMLANMPEEDRGKYVVQKSGDRKFSAAEAVAMAKQDDFPGTGGR